MHLITITQNFGVKVLGGKLTASEYFNATMSWKNVQWVDYYICTFYSRVTLIAQTSKSKFIPEGWLLLPGDSEQIIQMWQTECSYLFNFKDVGSTPMCLSMGVWVYCPTLCHKRCHKAALLLLRLLLCPGVDHFGINSSNHHPPSASVLTFWSSPPEYFATMWKGGQFAVYVNL